MPEKRTSLSRVFEPEEPRDATQEQGRSARLRSELASGPEDVEAAVADVPAGSPAAVPTVEGLAAWLLDTLGREPLAKVQHNPLFALPNVVEEASQQQWLATVLRMLFDPEDLTAICRNVDATALDQRRRAEACEKALTTLRNNLVQSREAGKELAAKAQDMESVLFRQDLRIKGSLTVLHLVDSMFGKGPREEKLRSLFQEAAERPGNELVPFVLAFFQGFAVVRETLDRQTPDEEARMSQVSQALRWLLANLSGKALVQRRAILSEVARLVSLCFDNYDFVSPEESWQVDLKIHNIVGGVSTNIVEGVSFAVLRRQSRQTVNYADVKVN